MNNSIKVVFLGNKRPFKKWFFSSFFGFFLWTYIACVVMLAVKLNNTTVGIVLGVLIFVHFIFSLSMWLADKKTWSSGNTFLDAIYTKKYIKKAKKYLKYSDWDIIDDLSYSTSSEIETRIDDFEDCQDYLSEDEVKELVEVYKITKKIYSSCNKKSNVKLAIYSTGITNIQGTSEEWVDDNDEKYKVEYNSTDNVLTINHQPAGATLRSVERGEHMKFSKKITYPSKRRALAVAVALKIISTNNHKEKRTYGYRVMIREKTNIGECSDKTTITVEISRRLKGQEY